MHEPTRRSRDRDERENEHKSREEKKKLSKILLTTLFGGRWFFSVGQCIITIVDYGNAAK